MKNRLKVLRAERERPQSDLGARLEVSCSTIKPHRDSQAALKGDKSCSVV